MSTAVYIGASSPLLTYSPSRNGATGHSWTSTQSGGSICAGPSTTFSVELDSSFFSEVVFVWEASGEYQVQVGLDGSLQSGSASSGGVTLSCAFGQHTARLEVSCPDCGMSDTFELVGIQLMTEVISTGGLSINTTLDDSSPQITYSGFTSTTTGTSPLPAIQNGQFYENTVSYTSTAGATVSFSFQGSAVYIFGPTGPTFGTFQLTLDTQTPKSFNASSSLETYNTLLYFATALRNSQHEIVITNLVDGSFFSLDYIVAVQPCDVSLGTTIMEQGTATATLGIGSAGATAVFPTPSGVSGAGNSGSVDAPSGTVGTVIGGIIGSLAGLAILYVWYRYTLYRKAGGKGDVITALFGSPVKAPVKKKEEGKLGLWPAVYIRPKYAGESQNLP